MGNSNTNEKRKQHALIFKSKYAVYSLLLSFAIIYIYSLILTIIKYSPEQSKSLFFTLLIENFSKKNFGAFLLPNIVFYVLYEELTFRKSLIPSENNIIISVILLFYLTAKGFLENTFSLYIFTPYAIFLIFCFKNKYSSDIAKAINVILALLSLSVFHTLKFTNEQILSLNLLIYNAVPMLILGSFLAYLRLKFNSFMSIITYLIFYLIVHLLLL